MRRWMSRILAGLFGIAFCISIICFVLEGVSYDVNYHMENLDVEAIKSELPVTDSEIGNVAKIIVDYIKGDKDDMQVELPGGQTMFNERELTHMHDVRRLFEICSFMKFACLGFCLMLFMGLYILNGMYCFKHIARGLTVVIIWLMIIGAFIGFWYYFDFSGFWTAFHKLAFTNDLWLMMPDDAIIIFYSAEFFTAIVRRILEQLAVILGVVLAVSAAAWIFLPGRKKGRKFE